MKVKIGNRIYDATKVPMMVILTPDDKENIANMAPDSECYAEFPGGFGTVKEMRAWMEVSKASFEDLTEEDSVELFSAEEIQELYEGSIGRSVEKDLDPDESFGDSLGRFLNNPIG